MYITQKVSGEPYRAYIPPKLLPEISIDLVMLYPHLEKATLALAELNSIHKTIPNTALFIYMKVTVPLLAKELKITAPTARSALNHMKSIGVLEEISGKKRDKVYIYRQYLDILEEGAEPFSTGGSS